MQEANCGVEGSVSLQNQLGAVGVPGEELPQKIRQLGSDFVTEAGPAVEKQQILTKEHGQRAMELQPGPLKLSDILMGE